MSAPPGIDTNLKVSTTKRKLTYVRPLQDFMQLKGKFMRYRMDPTYADVTPNYYEEIKEFVELYTCLLYTSPSPRDLSTSRMPSSA